MIVQSTCFLKHRDNMANTHHKRYRSPDLRISQIARMKAQAKCYGIIVGGIFKLKKLDPFM